MLMNSRGGPPILRGGPPLGTISMDQTVLTQYQDIFFPSGQKLLLLPPICLDLNSVRRLSHLERSVLQLEMSWSPAL